MIKISEERLRSLRAAVRSLVARDESGVTDFLQVELPQRLVRVMSPSLPGSWVSCAASYTASKAMRDRDQEFTRSVREAVWVRLVSALTAEDTL